MELLNVALQIIAIIAIIAVGAFIIVFLSDLLISIIDNQQGIFFRRNKGKEQSYDNAPIFDNSRVFTQTATKQTEQTTRGFNFDFDDEVKPSVKQEQIAPVSKKGSIDLELAKKEQELIEKANKNFFEDDDEDEQEEVESLEEKERKERIAKLEERNRQLEEELKKKEQALKETPKPVIKETPKPKVEEAFDDEETLDPYEKLIKQINKEVKQEFENDLQKKEAPKQEVKQQVKEEKPAAQLNRFAAANMFDFDEEEDDEEEIIEDEEVEEKEDEKYLTLAQELQALKEQLERERKERELLKLEAEEKAQKLTEEKQALEEALKVKKVTEVETKTVVVLDTEEEYVSRLELLEERLREAKKQLRNNKREFVPLNKIKRTLEKDQVKLRRKEAQVAKQKVALFGVNNNDIDPVKQAELEQEIDMLEGLKLSVQHCEDVMRENADRYPVLEQTHQILSKNVKNLLTDIEAINKKLQEVRKKKA